MTSTGRAPDRARSRAALPSLFVRRQRPQRHRM